MPISAVKSGPALSQAHASTISSSRPRLGQGSAVRNPHSIDDDTSIKPLHAVAYPEGLAFLYEVTTRFQKLARRGGAPKRETVLKNAGQAVESLANDFKELFRQRIQLLAEQAARRKLGDPLDDWYESACAVSRELRDLGGTFGYPLITFIAGNLCTVLDDVGPGIGQATLDCHIDALRLEEMEQLHRKGLGFSVPIFVRVFADWQSLSILRANA